LKYHYSRRCFTHSVMMERLVTPAYARIKQVWTQVLCDHG
jgi:hypothetical protein